MSMTWEGARSRKEATKLLFLGFAVLVAVVPALAYAQSAAPAQLPEGSNAWILTALHAIDELLSVGLAATLAGLSITAATFASGTKTSTTAEAERKFFKNYEDLEKFHEVTDKLLRESAADLSSDKALDLKKYLDNKIENQKESDKMESISYSMLGYLVQSFYMFISALFIIFVGDTFVGKYLPFAGVIFLVIEDFLAGILMLAGIVFLAKGAHQIQKMKVSRKTRADMLMEAFPIIKKVLDLPETK